MFTLNKQNRLGRMIAAVITVAFVFNCVPAGVWAKSINTDTLRTQPTVGTADTLRGLGDEIELRGAEGPSGRFDGGVATSIWSKRMQSNIPFVWDLPIEDYEGVAPVMRLDINVVKNGKVSGIPLRLKAIIPTAVYVVKELDGTPIIVAHNGKAAGMVDMNDSLGPTAPVIQQLLKEQGYGDIQVNFIPGSITEEGLNIAAVEKAIIPGAVNILENTRFTKGEETAGPEQIKLAEDLANLSKKFSTSKKTLFVFDAFGTAHGERFHASTTVVANYLDQIAFGRVMNTELENLSGINPAVVTFGGGPVKMPEKFGFLKTIIGNMKSGSKIILGTGPFSAGFGELLAKVAVGKAHTQEELKPIQEIIDLAKSRGIEFVLPVDLVVATNDLTATAKVEKRRQREEKEFYRHQNNA